MAAFVLRHPLVASAVFGATKLWQLQEVLNAFKVELTYEIIIEINKIHGKFPNPCPWSVVNAVQFIIKENLLDWLKGIACTSCNCIWNINSIDIIEGCQFCWCFPSGSDSHMTKACTYPQQVLQKMHDSKSPLQIIASSQLFMCEPVWLCT